MTEIQVIREDEKATAILKAIRLIDEGVEVGQVAHGRWEPVDARYSRCTNCKRERNIRTQIGWGFCPNCGANMGQEDADGQN